MRRRHLGALIVCLALAVRAAQALGLGAGRLGPYPSLGGCPVFPQSSASAGAASVGNESAWNQDVSSAPVDPNSDAYTPT